MKTMRLYVMKLGENTFKIGVSSNPVRRLKEVKNLGKNGILIAMSEQLEESVARSLESDIKRLYIEDGTEYCSLEQARRILQHINKIATIEKHNVLTKKVKEGKKVTFFPLNVTKGIVENATQDSQGDCAVAQALRIKGCSSTTVHAGMIRFNYNGHRYMCAAPQAVAKFICQFDKDKKKVKPFKVTLTGLHSAPIKLKGELPKAQKSRPKKTNYS